MQNLGEIWGNLAAKLKTCAPIISSVGNLQLSVGKLKLPAAPTLLTPDAAVHNTDSGIRDLLDSKSYNNL